jgi:DtxR family transcriptional regulator, Mn-dependent transcriptional regulator
MASQSKEDYIKVLYKLEQENEIVSNNAIAAYLKMKPSSVSDMLRKLANENYIDYTKYKGSKLTQIGISTALSIIRKHRLWETFLVKHLKFNWDQVHIIAEQLEHIDSDELIDKLDHFLNYPKSDPHGDPIPGKNGEIVSLGHIPLNNLKTMEIGYIAAIKKGTPSFLQYMDKIGIELGTKIKVIDKVEFDQSLEIQINNDSIHISNEVSKNILIKI